MIHRIFWLFVWGVAFAYIESSVVVYLRKIYYPEGFTFPFVAIEPKIAITEIVREAMTLVIMWATVMLAYRRLQSRVAAYLILFGVWDIFYYVFLKLLLDWPATFDTWDILFLIPSVWVGPVWAPVLVAATMIVSGVWILINNDHGIYLRYDKRFILLELLAASTIIASFILPGFEVLKRSVPGTFPVILYWAGYILGIATFVRYHTTRRKETKNA